MDNRNKLSKNNDFDRSVNKMLGAGVPFQRVRRITGYLAYVESFNDGKKAELKERVKHSTEICSCCN